MNNEFGWEQQGAHSEACRQASETAALRVLPWAVLVVFTFLVFA